MPTRSGAVWPATSAAAPDIRRSSPPWRGPPAARPPIRGTLGGNLANASPAADTVPPLYVADAVVELVSVSARRDVPVADFFTGPRQSVLVPDELIVGVRVPFRGGVRGCFLRLGQRQAQ